MPPCLGRLGTAYQSRTDDLLRERQMSWTTRRMRQFLRVTSNHVLLLKAGAKVRTFFGLAKYFLHFSFKILFSSTIIIISKQFRNIFFAPRPA